MAALGQRISSGEFDTRRNEPSVKEAWTRPVRKAAAKYWLGRGAAKVLAEWGREWQRDARMRMPEARGDIREIAGQPVFVPLFSLFLQFGRVFRLSFGPQSFVVVSDPAAAKHVLQDNAANYSKGLLAEILDFVMGKGLIPADGAVWKMRRRALQPALHRKYIAAMVEMFGETTDHACRQLEFAADRGETVEMENFFSRFALDIIGKAVFNYEFDALTQDDPVIKAVYTTLREAEHRSLIPFPYWNLPGATVLIPRQAECVRALQTINETLDTLISRCKALVENEDEDFVEEFLSKADPSILHFLIASGEEVTSKQLRDDLMTLLIAGHETSAAVLTWTLHLLSKRPEVFAKIRAEVDAVLGDRAPTVEDYKALPYMRRVIAESMRLYPQPPVLLRRALDDDVVGGFSVQAGQDLFISVWNLHHAPELWEDPEEFRPERFPLDEPLPTEASLGFKYLPFGGGRRKCIGEQFAIFESMTALATLTRRFDFAIPEDQPPVEMTTGATIHTTEGLHMRVARRKDVPPPPQGRGPPMTEEEFEQRSGLQAKAGEAGGKCPFASALGPRADARRPEEVTMRAR
jgi:beta-ring hydroxylase